MKKGFHEVRIQKCDGIEECKVLNPGNVDRFDTAYCFKGATVHVQLDVLDGVIVENQNITIETLRQNSLILDTNLTSETNGNIVDIKFTMPDNAVIVNIQPQYIVDPSKEEQATYAIYNHVGPHGMIMFNNGSTTFINNGILDKTSVESGMLIKLEVTPDDDYKIKNFKVCEHGTGKLITHHLNGSSTKKLVKTEFIMPSADVDLIVDFEEIQPENGIVYYFDIPDELARELSELLTKQTIRERLLSQLLDDPIKYEKAENMLIPITSKIEAIKVKITKQYVPAKYNSTDYMWNYDGYEVDGNKVQIIKVG